MIGILKYLNSGAIPVLIMTILFGGLIAYGVFRLLKIKRAFVEVREDGICWGYVNDNVMEGETFFRNVRSIITRWGDSDCWLISLKSENNKEEVLYLHRHFIGSIEDEKRIGGRSEITTLYEKMAGVDYSDNGIYDGVDLVESIIKIYRACGFKTQIIAASVRNALQVRKVAELGADIATIPFVVIKEMISHYKTEEGMKKFTDDIVEQYSALFEV